MTILVENINLDRFNDQGLEWHFDKCFPEEEFYNKHNSHYYHHWGLTTQLQALAEERFETYVGKILKQPPGQCIKPHRDGFKQFLDKNLQYKKEQVRRYQFFLQDWKPGHYFEIDEQPMTNWSAGDYIVHSYENVHMSANVGTEPKYTAQITGILKPKWLNGRATDL